jgi:predicted MFS family arabinose efflux permease
MALQRICDPMLPELSRVFDAPISEASRVISFFAIAYGLMQLFYGPVGDRLGKYRVVMLATIGCSVGCVLSALSADLTFLVAARVGTALAAAAIIPLSLAWVGDVVHYEQRQETLARVGLGTMLGVRTDGRGFCHRESFAWPTTQTFGPHRAPNACAHWFFQTTSTSSA